MKNENYFRLLTYLEVNPGERKELVKELKEFMEAHGDETPERFREALGKYD